MDIPKYELAKLVGERIKLIGFSKCSIDVIEIATYYYLYIVIDNNVKAYRLLVTDKYNSKTFKVDTNESRLQYVDRMLSYQIIGNNLIFISENKLYVFNIDKLKMVLNLNINTKTNEEEPFELNTFSVINTCINNHKHIIGITVKITVGITYTIYLLVNNKDSIVDFEISKDNANYIGANIELAAYHATTEDTKNNFRADLFPTLYVLGVSNKKYIKFFISDTDTDKDRCLIRRFNNTKDYKRCIDDIRRLADKSVSETEACIRDIAIQIMEPNDIKIHKLKRKKLIFKRIKLRWALIETKYRILVFIINKFSPVLELFDFLKLHL